MLVDRFPGLYIPPVPEKTKTKKNDDSTIRDRRYFLDLFLKECCALNYLAQSQELQIFLRPQGDVTQLMYNQDEKNLTEVLATYRATLPVVEDYQERDVNIFAEDVKKFMIEQEKMT